MKKIWFKRLGLKTFVIISIGRIFHYILVYLDYYKVHIPIKNEISELLDRNYEAQMANQLIYARHPGRNQKYLLRPQTSDKLVFYQVILNNEYSPIVDLIRFYEAHDAIKTIIDAGANIGLTSLYFKQHYPQARIIAIEPESKNHLHLMKNISLNKFSKSIIPIRKALWKNSTDKLSISSDFRDGQYWAKTVRKTYNEQGSISTIMLSELITQYFDNGNIDILKMDIEGSEDILFRNYSFVRTTTDKVKFISLEIHDELNCREFINKTLLENNFSIETIGETTFCVNRSLVHC